MRLGVLTKLAIADLNRVKENLEALEVLIRPALTNFRGAAHLKDRLPAELHFNPAELPTFREIGGLSVLPDSEVRPGFIRVTTIDIPIRDITDEFELTKLAFASQVQGAAYGS